MSMMDSNTLVSPEELTQWWAELGRDEQSPDYYELTEYGELVWSGLALVSWTGWLSLKKGRKPPSRIGI